MAKAAKIPATLGGLIDHLYKLRQKRLAKQKEADDMKERELALEGKLKADFKEADLDGARGKLATAGLKVDMQPTLEDWDRFIEYVDKNRAWDMLQKRLSTTAVRERLDAKLAVPGVGTVRLVKITLNKR